MLRSSFINKKYKLNGIQLYDIKFILDIENI